MLRAFGWSGGGGERARELFVREAAGDFELEEEGAMDEEGERDGDEEAREKGVAAGTAVR